MIESCGLSEDVAVGIKGLDQEAGFNLFSNSSCDFNGDVARDFALNWSADGADDFFLNGVGNLFCGGLAAAAAASPSASAPAITPTAA